MDRKELIENIRKGMVDINNHSLFFPIVIKGLIYELNKNISIRSESIPHFIIHTGDDSMYLSVKGQDASKEPLQITNENYVYNTIPRCIITTKGADTESDQLSSPYSVGQLQYEYEDSLYTLRGEFRRFPIKMTVSCKYYVDSWTDMMELMQQIITKMAFIKTYHISYMGQSIVCSYSISPSLEGEYMIDMDGTTQDNKSRTLEISLDVETNMPVWEPRTIVSPEDCIVYVSGAGSTNIPITPESQNKSKQSHIILYGTDNLMNNGEIVK